MPLPARDPCRRWPCRSSRACEDFGACLDVAVAVGEGGSLVLPVSRLGRRRRSRFRPSAPAHSNKPVVDKGVRGAVSLETWLGRAYLNQILPFGFRYERLELGRRECVNKTRLRHDK